MSEYEFNQPGDLTLQVNLPRSHNMTFHKDGVQIGELDFSGPRMTFTGDADESARIFFDWVAVYFAERLDDERKKGRE